MILQCSNITKNFNDNTILNNASFHIEENEKAAIVGLNGAGKSTLLKIITGEYTADEGTVTIARDKTLGYLAQHQDIQSDLTIYDELFSVKQDILEMEQRLRQMENDMKHLTGTVLDELMERYSQLNHEFEMSNGYAVRSETVGVLKGLGFSEDEFNKQVRTLSGGQKTRVSLGRLLLSKPDILLLDEPTNHLDLVSISWLENFLSNYRGSVIIVAHDRYFLDKIVTKVIEVDLSHVMTFTGNYSAYAAKKAQLRDAHLKEYYNQQKEIKHQQEVITKLKSFNREKSIKRAESREKMLAKIDVMDKPVTTEASMHFKLEPCKLSGNDVLTVDRISKSFDGKQLFENVCFEIKRGERVALIGANGTGKTTILKMITGGLKSDSGSIRPGANVYIGYYDQEHNVLHKEKTLFQEISDDYPDLTNTQIRNVLAAFLFTNDDVFNKIETLSGGERGRVSLARLMLSNANFLILDEPTNHLDITSKEILENALNNYTGTCLFVSHDRYFINSVATRILELTPEGVNLYNGNYDYYMEKKAQQSSQDTSVQASAAESASRKDWQAMKEEQARERKRKNEIEKIENKITELEDEDRSIDEELVKEEVFTDVPKLMELNSRKEVIQAKLEKLYSDWEDIQK